MELTRIKSFHPDQMGPLFLGGNLPADTLHLLRLKSITSWRSHEWRAAPWHESLINHLARAAPRRHGPVAQFVREVKVASEPEALLQVLRNPIYRFKRIGLEAGRARIVGYLVSFLVREE